MLSEDFSVGVDIESVERFEKYSNDKNCPFIKRIFSEKEIDYCFKSKNTSSHLAARFCAKEAVYKALSALGKNIFYSEIEILNCENGIPKINILRPGFENYIFKISLSHGNGNAIASVIVIKY